MFVLDELDKLLDNFIDRKERQTTAKKFSISLRDVPRIDVEQIQSTVDFGFPIKRMHDELTHRDNSYDDSNFNSILLRQSHMTVDLLFACMMRSAILSRLIEIPERQYASAKLVICDNESYDAIMKFQRISDKLKRSKFFIYQKPSNVTAIFLLQDIVDMFDLIRRPLVIIKEGYNADRRKGNFDYSIVKQVFPFLRMTDLTIILTGARGLNLGVFNTEEKRDIQILQFLSHFSRSVRLIDLQSINKQIGQQHPIYNNVSIFWPFKNNGEIHKGAHLKLTLSHLSHLASQLTLLAQRLNLNLQSITYRAGDPYGSARIFSQIVESILRAKPMIAASDKLNPTRILVLDRFFDLRGLLNHSDRYGPFYEQEITMDLSKELASKMNLIDDLDERLQLERLSDALSAILKYTIDLRQPEFNHNRFDKTSLSRDFLMPFIPTSQSIKKHMKVIKLIFKFLNEGYLLILKLEACLKDIMHKLRSLEEPLPIDQQETLVSRIERAMASFVQIIDLSGSSIKPINLIRLACNFIDVINVFVYVHSKSGQLINSCKTLLKIKAKILSAPSFRESILTKADTFRSEDGFEDDQKLNKELWNKLIIYDNLSKTSCESRAILPFEAQVEHFLSDHLDQEAYPKIMLAPSSRKYTLQTADECIILVILGSISFDEVSRIKILERSLKNQTKLNSQTKLAHLFTLTCGLIKPIDFLLSIN